MNRDGLADIWRERLDDCVRSGLSVKAWCASYGIPIQQYYYWRSRINQNAGTDLWLAVDVLEPAQQRPAATGGLSIRIADALIEVQPNFDPDLLRAVVQALGAIAC